MFGKRSGPKRLQAESQKLRATAGEMVARSIYVGLLGSVMFAPLGYIHVYAGPDTVLIVLAVLMALIVLVATFVVVLSALANWRASQSNVEASAAAAIVKENAKLAAYEQKAAVQLQVEAGRRAMRQKPPVTRRAAIEVKPMTGINNSVDVNNFEVT